MSKSDKSEIKIDIENKEHLFLNESNLNKKQNIGDILEDYEILMLLGEGSFGKVLKVRSKLNNNLYAMKIVDLKKIKDKNLLKYTDREAKILPKLSHPHILKYYNTFQKDSSLYIITEYIKNGDLSDLIRAHKKLDIPFMEEELWDIFYQCINALCYIHEKGIIHRDIKSLNIFIDDNMKIKIGDFGLSALNPSQYKIHKFEYSNGTYLDLKSNNSVVGTEFYRAKEMREKGEYDQKVDVYAMGCVFFELIYLDNIMGENAEEQKARYSNKILEIMSLMRQDNKNERYNSFQANEYIEKEYLKISKNSSIFSLITCLSSLKDLNNSLDITKK